MSDHHIYHLDTHTNGLCDDCPKCCKAIKEPTLLDGANLRRIWRGKLRTATDALVFNELYRAVVIVQRLGEGFAAAPFENLPMSEWDGLLEAHKPDAFELFHHGGRR